MTSSKYLNKKAPQLNFAFKYTQKKFKRGDSLFMTVSPTSPKTHQLVDFRGNSINENGLFDVIIIGSGPAGSSLGAELSKQNASLSVLIIDPVLDRRWPANYGVWMHEFEKTGYSKDVAIEWPKTSVFMKDGNEKLCFDLTYARIDRDRLKKSLFEDCSSAGYQFLQASVDFIDESDVNKTSVNIKTNDGTHHHLSSRLVIDATGHNLKFAKFQTEHEPGYQAAYGIECEVSEHNFPLDEMVLMDYRSEHMKGSASEIEEAENTPLFLYVMPLSPTRIFLEETSLIASPAVSFEYLKKQLYKRLHYMNVQVKNVEEEEFCLIPMGGSMPRLDQRIVAFGGAAGFVHPSTGYSVTRTMNQARLTAPFISKTLQDHGAGPVDELSTKIWNHIWSPTRIRQRDFLVFGGDVLQKLKLSPLREFFCAFFALDVKLWSEFLAFGLLQPQERLVYGLQVFFNTSNRVRKELVSNAIFNGGPDFFFSVLPLGFNAAEVESEQKSKW
eukprot:CAMPEP_0182443574 /NCGR_PEP_ID=MMETSP1172-20130603/2278_1 /TAXON_ID=708627 /ORGANISM="Timspurckia oligopyrenoides, Strain CCMP3278" /LENGTH=498 /DNA_ID=CAMNT_0024638903 /DNA_START=179 /DNA_END=1675 /DNA_ORIENTATION=-